MTNKKCELDFKLTKDYLFRIFNNITNFLQRNENQSKKYTKCKMTKFVTSNSKSINFK